MESLLPSSAIMGSADLVTPDEEGFRDSKLYSSKTVAALPFTTLFFLKNESAFA